LDRRAHVVAAGVGDRLAIVERLQFGKFEQRRLYEELERMLPLGRDGVDGD
jgi:hypothetical protein